MKAKIFLLIFFFLMVPALTGCSSSSSGDTSGMKAAIQVEAEDQGYTNAKWPFFEEDWHFKKQSDGNYTSYGTFKTGNKKHQFSAEVDPDSDGILDFYAN